jgi:hypothetical protein
VEGAPDELIADADWNGEMALRAHIAGFDQEALAPADRAVKYTRQILRYCPRDQTVIDLLIGRHRLRAEIHQALGDHRAALVDGDAAITLLDRLDDPPPLVKQAVLLLQCEEYAVLGDAAAARTAGQAIEAYRLRAREPDASPLAMAEAFGRYAMAMALIGDAAKAQEARLQAITAYQTVPRHWFSMKADRLRFVHLVQAYVTDVVPSDEEALRVVPMLQDAAEHLLRLIPPDLFAMRDPTVQDYAAAIMQMVATQGQWLAALGELEAAVVFAQRAPTLLDVPVPWWPDWLDKNRELMQQALAAES